MLRTPDLRGFAQWVGSSRATLAIVFTDIVGSTAMVGRVGDERMGEIRSAHFARSDALIREHAGYTIKTIGDSVMAVFRSVGAAFDYAYGLHRDPGHIELQLLGVRAGIHVGSVDVNENDIDGIEVAVAARVVHAIEGAEIWLSQQAIFDLKAHRSVRHKGLFWGCHPGVELKGIGIRTLWSLAPPDNGQTLDEISVEDRHSGQRIVSSPSVASSAALPPITMYRDAQSRPNLPAAELASGLLLPGEPSERLTALVVCRETGSGDLVTVTERALILARSNHNLEALSGKSIAVSPQQIHENVFRLNVGMAFVDQSTMIDCLRAVCHADIVIFDVTSGNVGIEPGIMLLLGVRAVARRGLSICSVDCDPDRLVEVGLPYNLQQLNLATHGGGIGEFDAAERLSFKLANGWHDLVHDLAYLDLPAFDPIRNLGGDLNDYAPIPFYRGPLYLGPFDESFQHSCFHKLEPEIAVMLDSIARAKDGRDYKRPRVFRLMDYDRARMVSQSLYHSIRRHDFCLIDWTWLRPNVFFEFGVRLASRHSGDVHIVADLGAADAVHNDFGLGWPKPTRDMPIGEGLTRLKQAEALRAIFKPIEYEPRSVANLREASAAILDRWKATRELRYRNAAFFQEIARAAVSTGEGAIEAVANYLRRRSALTYPHDQDTLLGTLLYEDHNSGLQKSAISQSIALKLAELFLRMSGGRPPTKGLQPADEIEELGQEIRRLARRGGTADDVETLTACLNTISRTFTSP